MKTIGVIGGIGPQATMEFESLVHREARRLVPPRANAGYPPMVVYYHRRPPFRFDERGAPLLPFQADPDLIQAAERIGAMADFLVITANAPHLVQGEIERASGREVLSLIDVTLEECRERGWKRLGVLGMGMPAVYQRRLEPHGCEVLDPEPRARLDAAIGRVMEGREDGVHRGHARDAVTALRARGVDGIILGCTEIPLLLGNDAEAPDLLNPLPLLALRAVQRALA